MRLGLCWLLFLVILVALVGMPGCGVIEGAAKKDSMKQQAPKKNNSMLDGAEIRTEGANTIVVDDKGVNITGSKDSYTDDGTLIEGRPAKVEIKFNKMAQVSEDQGNMEMTDETALFNFLRLGGMSPNNVMAMNQGLKADKTPFGSFWGGQQKGFGKLEQLWAWLVQAFWTILGIALLLAAGVAVLCIIPVTRPIGLWLVRIISSLIPGFSAVVTPLLEKVQKDKYEAVVAGTENFKTSLPTLGFSAEDQEKIKQLLRTEQAKAQSKALQEEIKKNTA